MGAADSRLSKASTASVNAPHPGFSEPAEQNWRRFEYAKQRGHTYYVEQARRCEGFYLGAGLQWSNEDRQALRDTGNRPAYEWNEVFPAINAAVGYQIHNRMDIAYLPRGGLADTTLATIRSKVAMQVCDDNKFHWLETQVFSDGLIEQRGYYDIRMDFEKNVYGDIRIIADDPRDVIPDPDGKSYDPKEWYDVLVCRWLTLDLIEELYGLEARQRAEIGLDSEGDFGTQDDSEPRNKFGTDEMNPMWDAYLDDDGARHYRVIDRQRWRYRLTDVAVYPDGKVKNIENVQPDQLAEYTAQGAMLSKRMHRQVHWTVTTRWATLFDAPSPYDRFTIVPYFCYFRRGRTRGMVDNAISPQEVLNKAISQFVHILNTTANSGWVVEENSLVNMQPEDLEKEGAKTGLLVIYKQGSQPPVKIQPNAIPTGLDKLIEHAKQAVRDATVDPSLRGLTEKEESGIARQTQQFAAQQGLAIPLDNLARTRHLVADHISYLMSNFYDNHRIFRITETDPRTGKNYDEELEVNRFDPVTQRWSNDLTEGDYDVVVTEAPMQITFENSQFEQGLEMRKLGINIPDNVLVKHSNLADKAEILEQMENTSPPPPSPLEEAKTALATAQAESTKVDTVNKRVTAQFSAVQAGQAIAATPAIAPLADQLLKSSGFEDQDAPPIVAAGGVLGAMPMGAAGAPPVVPAPGTPQPTGPAAPGTIPVKPNTSPAFPPKPASPAKGLNTGIEGAGSP